MSFSNTSQYHIVILPKLYTRPNLRTTFVKAASYLSHLSAKKEEPGTRTNETLLLYTELIFCFEFLFDAARCDVLLVKL